MKFIKTQNVYSTVGLAVSGQGTNDKLEKWTVSFKLKEWGLCSSSMLVGACPCYPWSIDCFKQAVYRSRLSFRQVVYTRSAQSEGHVSLAPIKTRSIFPNTYFTDCFFRHRAILILEDRNRACFFYLNKPSETLECAAWQHGSVPPSKINLGVGCYRHNFTRYVHMCMSFELYCVQNWHHLPDWSTLTSPWINSNNIWTYDQLIGVFAQRVCHAVRRTSIRLFLACGLRIDMTPSFRNPPGLII